MLKYASISKFGDRAHNEDCAKVSFVGDRYCFVVCDGLGGHELGEIASQAVANTFVDEFYYCTDISAFLSETFEKAQNKLSAVQEENDTKHDIKTTAVAMVADDQVVYVGHVGDSRFYGFKKSGDYVRTMDHSVPQLLVQSNTITEQEIRNHPNRSMLLKVMGDCSDEPICELQPCFSLNDFDAFLLCTDGFWEYITEDEMQSTRTQSQTPKEWLDKMEEIVKQRGSDTKMDNYSAITVFNIV